MSLTVCTLSSRSVVFEKESVGKVHLSAHLTFCTLPQRFRVRVNLFNPLVLISSTFSSGSAGKESIFKCILGNPFDVSELIIINLSDSKNSNQISLVILTKSLMILNLSDSKNINQISLMIFRKTTIKFR